MEATAPRMDEYNELPDIHEFGRRNMELSLRKKKSDDPPPTPEQLAASFSIRVEDAKRLQARYYAILAHANDNKVSMEDAKKAVESKISVYKYFLKNGQHLRNDQVKFLIDTGESQSVIDFFNNEEVQASQHPEVIKNKDYIRKLIEDGELVGGRKRRGSKRRGSKRRGSKRRGSKRRGSKPRGSKRSCRR